MPSASISSKSNYPHLIAALSALLLAAGLLSTGTIYAQSIEQKYIRVLAPLMLPQSNMGSALQQAAFRQPDLLVVYGSSEMLFENTPHSAFNFFQSYPTGFTVYQVAEIGATSLNMAQDMAAIGSELHGKRVVFSFTPTMFNAAKVSQSSYAADFSLLHANALIFNSSLSLLTKQIAANRMNEYPDTLKKDLVLQFAIRQLSCRCWYGPYLYNLVVPLGQLDTWIIRLQDHWEALKYLSSHPKLNPLVAHKPAQIDWTRQIAQAATMEKTYSSNNSYGIKNDTWVKIYARMLVYPRRNGSGDAQFIQNLNKSKEWTDLDLALRVLKELGGQPLVMSRPINGLVWNDAMGVSWQARQAYYLKLQRTISAYHFPFVDFASHDRNRYFSIDLDSHTNWVGWVYVDQVLDAFFHGRIN